LCEGHTGFEPRHHVIHNTHMHTSSVAQAKFLFSTSSFERPRAAVEPVDLFAHFWRSCSQMLAPVHVLCCLSNSTCRGLGVCLLGEAVASRVLPHRAKGINACLLVMLSRMALSAAVPLHVLSKMAAAEPLHVLSKMAAAEPLRVLSKMAAAEPLHMLCRVPSGIAASMTLTCQRALPLHVHLCIACGFEQLRVPLLVQRSTCTAESARPTPSTRCPPNRRVPQTCTVGRRFAANLVRHAYSAWPSRCRSADSRAEIVSNAFLHSSPNSVQ
jgi:hypothetical protein